MPIEKETINIENVITDCREQFYETVTTPLIGAPITFILSFWLIKTLISTNKLEHRILIWIVLPASLLIFCIFTGVLITAFKNFGNVFRKNFEVKTDKLVHKINEINSPPGKTKQRHRPCTLEFSNLGKFNIYNGTNYHSSKQYKMWYEELFRSSKIGDEFYVVMDTKDNILIVYNTKFFELKK